MKKIAKSKFYNIILLLILSVVAAVRGDTRDTAAYVYIFKNSIEFPYNPFDYYSVNNVEIGYGLLSWLVNSIGFDHRVLFYIISFLTFYFVYKSANLLKIRFLEVVLYYLGSFYLLQQMMQVRQGLATAIGFYFLILIVNINEGKWRKMVAGILLASLIHISSLLLFAAYPFNRLKVYKQRSLTIIRLMAIVVIVGVMSNLVLRVGIFDGLSKVSIYTSSEAYGYSRGLFEPGNLKSIMVFIVIIAFSATSLLERRDYNFLAIMYSFGLGMRLGLLETAIFSGRIGSLFGFAEIFILPLVVQSRIGGYATRLSIAFLVFLIQFYATVNFQVPDMVSDYFRPIGQY